MPKVKPVQKATLNKHERRKRVRNRNSLEPLRNRWKQLRFSRQLSCSPVSNTKKIAIVSNSVPEIAIEAKGDKSKRIPGLSYTNRIY